MSMQFFIKIQPSHGSQWVDFLCGGGEEYLLIFGNCYNAKTKADYTTFDYRGYLYNCSKSCFERI